MKVPISGPCWVWARRSSSSSSAATAPTPATFSVQYRRSSPGRLDPAIESSILQELAIDQQAIQHPAMPLRSYNYSYVRRRLQTHHRQSVSLATIIARAKQHGFYQPRRPRKVHDREVLTRSVGELIQHDSSHHLWAPAAGVKWYLSPSLDDYSRDRFFAQLVEAETVWTPLEAVQRLVLRHGYPYAYYVDCHAIFRFVRGRDALHVRQQRLTDAVDPQWKQTLRACGIRPIYALSPQAKGKIERPYRWLQDPLVRTCLREEGTSLGEANRRLAQEVHDYNYQRVHSTTGQIPYVRFQQALTAKPALFRPCTPPPPFQSAKDLFCLRVARTTNAYRRIALDTLQFSVRGVDPHQPVTLRLTPRAAQLAEIRFWPQNRLVDVQPVKCEDVRRVHF